MNKCLVTHLASSVEWVDGSHIVMHPAVWIAAAKVILTSRKRLLRWACLTTLLARIPALGRLQILAKLTHPIVIHPLVIRIAFGRPTRITAFHRVGIPIDIGRIRWDLVFVSIGGIPLTGFRLGEHLGDSMATHKVGILHVPIPSILGMLHITLILGIVDTVPWVMSLRQPR